MPIRRTIGSLVQTVPTPGTAVALSATDLWVTSLVIQAKKVGAANTGNIFVGDSTVDKTTKQLVTLANNSSAWEFPIPAGAAVNLADIYIDAATADDGVVGAYTTEQ